MSYERGPVHRAAELHISPCLPRHPAPRRSPPPRPKVDRFVPKTQYVNLRIVPRSTRVGQKELSSKLGTRSRVTAPVNRAAQRHILPCLSRHPSPRRSPPPRPHHGLSRVWVLG